MLTLAAAGGPGLTENRTRSLTVPLLLSVSGTLADGRVFDSSRCRGKPFKFKIGHQEVIRGWEDGIAQVRTVFLDVVLNVFYPRMDLLDSPQMSVGQRAKLICSPDFAYGSKGHPGIIPPNATLIFDVELLSLEA